jgi:hypothetical protein
MGIMIQPNYPKPIPTSVGCIRYRSMIVSIFTNGFVREWEGEFTYYKKLTITTSYVGMKKDNPSPTPDTTYTVTPAIHTETYTRGWSSSVTANNDTVLDTEDPPEIEDTPEVWTPPLTTNPTFGSPTFTETETATTYVSQATGVWSGTKTEVTEWSDPITDEELTTALEDKRDGTTFDDSIFDFFAGNFLPNVVYSSDYAAGLKTLTLVEYSLGTYSGRPSIAAVELPIVAFSFSETPQPTGAVEFSTDLTQVVTLPTGALLGQESFRDDNKQLFGGWRRVDLHDRFPDEDTVQGAVFLIPLSGHTLLSTATGTTTFDRGWATLGNPAGPPELANTVSFILSHGPYTPP